MIRRGDRVAYQSALLPNFSLVGRAVYVGWCHLPGEGCGETLYVSVKAHDDRPEAQAVLAAPEEVSRTEIERWRG